MSGGQRRRVGVRGAARSLAPFFALLGACASDRDLLVEVRGAPSLAIDQLSVEAYEGASVGPIARRSLGPAPQLPQRFWVRLGDETREGGDLKLTVHGYLEGELVGSGDIRVPMGASTATVELTESCRGVTCPALMVCESERASCDGACAEDADCAELLGCSAEATCARGAGDGLGTCAGEGADLDGDGALDARCAIGASTLDCDDTERLASPTPDTPRCGALRDHECNGIVDELELCPGCGTAELVFGTTHSVPLGAPVQAVAGPRPTPNGALVLAATASEIVLVPILADGTNGTVVRVPATDTRDLFLVGPLLAAATRDGLALFEVTNDANIRALGPPLPVPALDPVALTAVTVARGTAWVSGDGVALAAVDVRDAQNPRFLGHRAGPMATQLVPFAGGVIGNVAAPGAFGLHMFAAEPARAPGEPVPVPLFEAGAGEAAVTALVARTPRPGSGETGVVVMAAAAEQISVLDRSAGGELRLRDQVALDGLASALWLDDALAVVVMRDGRLLVLPRGAEAGALEAPTFEGKMPRIDAVTDVDVSTGTGNGPRLVVGSGDAVVLVELRCLG